MSCCKAHEFSFNGVSLPGSVLSRVTGSHCNLTVHAQICTRLCVLGNCPAPNTSTQQYPLVVVVPSAL